MKQQRRYDPTIKGGKIKLKPIEWEKLLILDKREKEHGEQPKKKRKKRRSKYQLSRKQLLEVFDRHYSNVKWNLCGTLTFDRKDLELWRKKRAFDQWISVIRSYDTDRDPQWLRVRELRAEGEGSRFHVFIKTPSFISKYMLMARWNDFVGGEADLSYVRDIGAARKYLEDVTLCRSDFEVHEDID